MKSHKILGILLALLTITSLPSHIRASCDHRERNHEKKCSGHSSQSPALACIDSKKVKRSMKRLFDAFVAVDEGFNTKGGLTAEEILALGYFGPLTSTIALGPFTPDVCGHTDHTNQPGAFQAIGAMESAQVQIIFEGGLLHDPNFPYDNLSEAPKIFHEFPFVTACLGNDLVNVTAVADVRYPGFDGPLVARITSLAQYRLQTNKHGKVIIPQIVWIDFFISYFDCQ